jgi:hypothetical protein
MSDELFADIPVYDETKGDFKKVKFLKIIPGYPVRVRVLNKSAYRVSKHYLPKQKISIVCLEENCPICANNKKLALQNKDMNYSDIPGIINRQNRFLVNVLNRTKVKTTSTEHVVYAGADGKFPSQHPETGEDLTQIKATSQNTIEVLERGSTLFGQLNGIYDTIRDEEGNKIGLTNFDIILTASGKGRQMTVSAVAQPQFNDEVKLLDTDLYDLTKVPMKLSEDELIQVLNGVSLQDIFEARKSTPKEESELEGIAEDVSLEVEDTIGKLFDDMDV